MGIMNLFKIPKQIQRRDSQTSVHSKTTAAIEKKKMSVIKETTLIVRELTPLPRKVGKTWGCSTENRPMSNLEKVVQGKDNETVFCCIKRQSRTKRGSR